MSGRITHEFVDTLLADAFSREDGQAYLHYVTQVSERDPQQADSIRVTFYWRSHPVFRKTLPGDYPSGLRLTLDGFEAKMPVWLD